jgi:MinD superfamily P-loop ATPase
MAVLVNRDVPEDTSVETLCRKWEVPIVARIPFSRKVAETYARGGLMVEESPEFRELLRPIPSLMRELRAGKVVQA